jgi:hypothetical protein
MALRYWIVMASGLEGIPATDTERFAGPGRASAGMQKLTWETPA